MADEFGTLGRAVDVSLAAWVADTGKGGGAAATYRMLDDSGSLRSEFTRKGVAKALRVAYNQWVQRTLQRAQRENSVHTNDAFVSRVAAAVYAAREAPAD